MREQKQGVCFFIFEDFKGKFHVGGSCAKKPL